MQILSYVSDILIPVLVFGIVLYGLIKKTKVYESFVKGAKDGLGVVVEILPTLVGLMIAVGVLRASGFLTFMGTLLAPFTEKILLPSELVPVVLIKMFSGSAATGLVLDIFKKFGPDSYLGRVTSILMSSTETLFYTMSVYYMTAKVTKSRYTVKGALLSMGVSLGMSIWLAHVS